MTRFMEQSRNNFLGGIWWAAGERSRGWVWVAQQISLKTTFQGKVDDEEDDRDNSDSRGKPNHELKSLVFQGAFLFWRCLTAGQRPPDTALERATLLQHSRTLVLKGERIWMRRRKGALRNHHRSRSTFRRCSWSTRFLLPFPLLTHTITTTTPSKSVKDRQSPP
jgi:hypothetical protein